MMPEKPKILHVITRLDKGGSAENTLLTVLETDKKRYEVQLVIGPSYESRMSREERASIMAGQKKAEEDGVKIVTVPYLIRRINLILDLLAFISLFVLFVKEKPTIVHTHTSKAGLLGRWAAKLARVPIIVHTPHGHVFFGYFGPLKTEMFIFLERLSTRLTDRIVALTSREKAEYESFKIAGEEKLTVINSGVDLDIIRELPFPERQQLKREMGIPEQDMVVGTAGRLEPVKGPEHLIEAARFVLSVRPDVCFVFAGDGTLKPDLKQKACDLGIQDKILFLGWRKDVTKVISIYDIFVFPSLNEGMGRVLVEAMTLGKPIVASNVGGIPDVVMHGKNGFLVPPKDPGRLAECIQLLLNDQERREKMGAEGKAMALKFSKDIMVERLAKLYEELQAKKSFSVINEDASRGDS
jgi:glycosyltransferase involved in cell wall biosynthesis